MNYLEWLTCGMRGCVLLDEVDIQCSCLENPRDGGAWLASVYGVAESDKTEAT